MGFIHALEIKLPIEVWEFNESFEFDEDALVGGDCAPEACPEASVHVPVQVRRVELPHAHKHLTSSWLLAIIALIAPHNCKFANAFCEEGGFGGLESSGEVEGFAVGESAARPVVVLGPDDLVHGAEGAVLFERSPVVQVNHELVQVDEAGSTNTRDGLSNPNVDGHAVEVGQVV